MGVRIFSKFPYLCTRRDIFPHHPISQSSFHLSFAALHRSARNAVLNTTVNRGGRGWGAYYLQASYLVVGQEALGSGVVPGRTAARLLVDVGAHLVVGVALREREGAAVEGNAHDKLVWRAAVVDPQLHSVILQEDERFEPICGI